MVGGAGAGLVGNVVEVAVGIADLVVDGRRNGSMAHSQYGDDRLDRPGPSEDVASHRLRRGDWHPISILAESELDGGGLGRVLGHGRSAVGVDVADLGGPDAGIFHGSDHRPRRPGGAGPGQGYW